MPASAKASNRAALSGKLARPSGSDNPTSLKQELEQLLLAGVRQLVGSVLAQMPAASEVTLERTRDPQHGEFSTNLAMRLAKAARKSPRELAQALVAALPASELVARTEIAGAGFINFHLAAEAYARELLTLTAAAEREVACIG